MLTRLNPPFPRKINQWLQRIVGAMSNRKSILYHLNIVDPDNEENDDLE
jgi:hypothetical protein